MYRTQWLIWAYLLLTLTVIITFIGPINIETTTAGIVVGTIVTTVGAVVLTAVPAYIMSGVLSGVIKLPPVIHKIVEVSAYVLAGMPSIILGIVGFLVFCFALELGWSMISAMLTLMLLLYPTLITAFTQVLTPVNNRYRFLAKSHGVGAYEFLFKTIPSLNYPKLFEVLVLGWVTSLGDTAAVMLTCGALTDFPSSLFDSIRLINYHIFLLAMEVPGGMPEARSLSLMLIIFLLVILAVPRILVRKMMQEQGVHS